jgi:molybdenum cofactor cytidylyltransferase
VAVAAILLAAGESTRMGSPKPLLPWGDRTLIEYQVQQLREAGVDDVVAVLGHCADDIAPLAEAAGARVVLNPNYPDGRATSLVAGALVLPDPETIVVANVDQPRPAHVIRTLIDDCGVRMALITAPVYNGERGHPVVLDGRLLEDLRAATDENLGLRGVIGGHEGEVFESQFETAVVLLDLNTLDDYERALKTYFAEAHP